MPVLTEPPSMGDVLKYEVNPNYTREVITLLDATRAASHNVWVAPVYWYSIPSPLKTYLDHWSA